MDRFILIILHYQKYFEIANIFGSFGSSGKAELIQALFADISSTEEFFRI